MAFSTIFNIKNIKCLHIYEKKLLLKFKAKLSIRNMYCIKQKQCYENCKEFHRLVFEELLFTLFPQNYICQ